VIHAEIVIAKCLLGAVINYDEGVEGRAKHRRVPHLLPGKEAVHRLSALIILPCNPASDFPMGIAAFT